MRLHPLLGVICVLAMGTSLTAEAGTLTFGTSPGDLADPGQSISSGGFTFSPQNGANSYIALTEQSNIIGNGTVELFAANHTILTMSRPAPFSLDSLDLGGSFADLPDRWASGLTITGYYAAGGSVTTTSALPITAAMETVSLPANFTGLSSVVFTPSSATGFNNYEFVLDNITYDLPVAAPLPSTVCAGLGLLGGLGVLMLASRRKTAAAV